MLIVTFVMYRISMIFLLLFLVLFLPLRYSKKVTFLIAVGCYLLTGVLDGIKNFVLQTEEVVFPILFSEIIIVQLTAFLLCRYKDVRALFTGITSSTYVLIGNIFFIMIFVFKGNACLALAFQILIHGGFLLYLTLQIRKKYLTAMRERKKFWGYMCLIPALFYAVVMALTTWPSNFYYMPQNWLALILIMFLMAASYVLMISLFSQQRTDYQLKRNNEFLETYAEHLKNEAEMLLDSETKTAIIRHDIKHILSLIDVYLKAGEMEKVHELISEVNGKLEEVRPRLFCKNTAINGIIGKCARMAENNEVSFLCEAEIPQELSVNEFEFATVVSNLLENAIQAAALVPDKNKRLVKMTARQIKGQEAIEISNTFTGEYTLSEETGLPVSEKGDGHGYGLYSVQGFAEKYEMLFDYSIEDELFYVRLSFCL